MPKLAQTRFPELSRVSFCAIVRAESEPGTEMERFPRCRNNSIKSNIASGLNSLNNLHSLKHLNK
eukprot:4457990-Alexandrium_andersonii.AAC.1